jgi:tetratricopeptide (TPR) repeat protein
MPKQKSVAKVKVHVKQGDELKQQGKIEESIASYQEALKLKPDASKPLLKLAGVYEAQKIGLK